MLAYGLLLFFLVPAGVALGFLCFSNSLLRRAAVFFMAAVLGISAVFFAWLGGSSYRPSAHLLQILKYLFSAGSFALLGGVAWLGWRWKNIWLMGLVAVQAVLLGWICLIAEADALAYGEFVADHLAMPLLLLVNIAGPLILLSLYERGSETGMPTYCFAASALVISAMNGLVLAGQLLWLFFFWQMGMLASVFSVMQGRLGQTGRFLGYTTIIHALGGVFFLGGICLCMGAAKTLEIKELFLIEDISPLMFPLAMFILAGLISSSQFPFQGGLLRSSSLADAKICALLQGITMLNAGVYLILRLSPLFMNTWLAKIAALLGAFSFVAGSMTALLHHEVKRGLTYSSVSMMGLAIALACMAELQAIYAAIWVMVFHGLGKALLFLCVDARQRHCMAGYGLIAVAVFMIMPPFGIAMGIWTAIEGAVKQPIVLVCLAAGSLIHLLYWAKFISARVTDLSMCTGLWRDNFFRLWPHLILGAILLALSLFQITLNNRFFAPILKENFSRFSDIAQSDTQSFFVGSFSGVNPSYLLFSIAVACMSVLWLLSRVPAFLKTTETQGDISNNEQTMDESENADLAKADSMLQGPPAAIHDAMFFRLPARRRLELYCNLLAGAMIMIMFEVIAR